MRGRDGGMQSKAEAFESTPCPPPVQVRGRHHRSPGKLWPAAACSCMARQWTVDVVDLRRGAAGTILAYELILRF